MPFYHVFDSLHFWQEYKLLQAPPKSIGTPPDRQLREPAKTPYGWLLLTHAVGNVCVNTCSVFTLLTFHDPEIVLTTLDDPFKPQ